MDRLLLRLYSGEEDTCLCIWMDASRSMAYGRPEKIEFARRIAGALLYVALSSHDRAALMPFSDTIGSRVNAQRGPRSAPRLWNALQELECAGATNFGAIGSAATSVPRGVAVIISDFLTESDPAPAIAALRRGGSEAVLLQVLAPQEADPRMRGDVRLHDSETGADVEITATQAVIRNYQAALHDHEDRLRALANSHGARFLSFRSDTAIEDAIRELCRAGLLR